MNLFNNQFIECRPMEIFNLQFFIWVFYKCIIKIYKLCKCPLFNCMCVTLFIYILYLFTSCNSNNYKVELFNKQ